MMKRMAAFVCRWEGATSPGSTICTLPDSMWVAEPPALALFNVMTRRCASGPGCTSSPARFTKAEMSVHRQWAGW
jgi:hypothetical protein